MEWVYQESNLAAANFRQQYTTCLNRLLEERRPVMEKKRDDYAATIFGNEDTARQDFVEMLGWPLKEYVPAQPLSVRSTRLFENEKMTIDRVQLELWENFWFGGLLFLHRDDQQRPFMLCQHGGAGTPELVSGLLEMGSVNYNGLTKRCFEKGANCFAPQLFLWDLVLFGYGIGEEGKNRDEIRRGMDISLKNMGGSIIAVELTCLRRALDYFEHKPYVKPDALGMAGLSYGGQYALFTPAVEPRLKASLSSCYFSDRNKMEWSDFTWFNAGAKFLDAEIAMLTHPRKLFIQIGENDQGFHSPDGMREWARLQKLCAGDTDWVNFHCFKGQHEFDTDDTQLDALMQYLWQL